MESISSLILRSYVIFIITSTQIVSSSLSVSLYSAVPSQRFHLKPRDLLERSWVLFFCFLIFSRWTCGTASEISPSAKPSLTFLELSSPLSHLQPQNLLKPSKRFHLQPQFLNVLRVFFFDLLTFSCITFFTFPLHFNFSLYLLLLTLWISRIW